MSVVTDIILVTGIDDKPNGASPLRDYYPVQVDDFAGGNKAMQCEVFMAAINHLDQKALIDDFKKTDWDQPEQAQLMLKGENDDCFAVYKPTLGAE